MALPGTPRGGCWRSPGARGNGVSCSGVGMPWATSGVHARLCLCLRAGPEGREAGLVKNEDSVPQCRGWRELRSPHGPSQAPRGGGQAALAPDLCLTRRSQQLLQGADVTLVCEGPQDFTGHQQDPADRSGDHQGKGVLRLCLPVSGWWRRPVLWYLQGGTPTRLPSICVSSN